SPATCTSPSIACAASSWSPACAEANFAGAAFLSSGTHPREERDMTIKKRASAHWQGGIKDGKGSISTQSGVLQDQPYGFNTRFEDQPGTNPEELIGTAHAGCFSMALSKELGDRGMLA